MKVKRLCGVWRLGEGKDGKGKRDVDLVVRWYQSPETDPWTHLLQLFTPREQADTRLMDISRPTHSGLQPQRLVTGRR